MAPSSIPLHMSIVVIRKADEKGWSTFLSTLAEELVMIRYLCHSFSEQVSISDWFPKHIKSVPVEKDDVIDEDRCFFAWSLNVEQKQESIRNARSKFQNLLRSRKTEIPRRPFFGVHSVMKFEDTRILEDPSVSAVILLDDGKGYRGHVYLYPGPGEVSSKSMTMQGIRASVQNLMCQNPIKNVGSRLADESIQICCREKCRTLWVDAPCGPMPQILFDMGFRIFDFRNPEKTSQRPEKIVRIGAQWFGIAITKGVG